MESVRKQWYSAVVVSDYEFAWTLHNTSVVLPLQENVPPPIPYDFQFKNISAMFRYANLKTPMNIKCLIVGAFPEKKLGRDMYGHDLIAKDFVIVDAEKTYMLMRLWMEKINEYGDILSGDLPEATLFVGMNMKVTIFNGLSFSSCFNRAFLKEPLIHEGPALKAWYVLNKKDVDHLVSIMAYNDTDMFFRKPAAADIIPITEAMATLESIDQECLDC